MAEVTIHKLQRKVEEFLAPQQRRLPTDSARRSAVEVLTRTVRKGWRTYLVGGFLRDVVVHPHSHWPRDFDIVVEGCSWDELSTVFTDIVAGQNRFGGLTLRRQTEVPGKYNPGADDRRASSPRVRIATDRRPFPSMHEEVPASMIRSRITPQPSARPRVPRPNHPMCPGIRRTVRVIQECVEDERRVWKWSREAHRSGACARSARIRPGETPCPWTPP